MHCSTQGASLLPAAVGLRHSNVRAPLRVVVRSHTHAQHKRATEKWRTHMSFADTQERVQSATDEKQEDQSGGLNGAPSSAAHEGVLTCSYKPCCLSGSSGSGSAPVLFLERDSYSCYMRSKQRTGGPQHKQPWV